MAGCWQHTDFRPSTCSQCGGTVFGFDGEDMCFTCQAKDAVISVVSPTCGDSHSLPAVRGTGDGCTRDEPLREVARTDATAAAKTLDSDDNCSTGSRRKRSDRKSRKKRPPCAVHESGTPPGDSTANCTCRRRRKRRPSPEGVDEYDKVIYGQEMIFSDYGSDQEPDPAAEALAAASAERLRRVRARTGAARVPQQTSTEALFAEAAHRVSNSSTTLKFAIISVELKNIGAALRKVKDTYTQLARPPPLPGQWFSSMMAAGCDDVIPGGDDVILQGLEVT